MELKPIFPVSQNINQTSYYWFEYGFTSDEVDKINNDAKNPWLCAYTYQKYKAHICPIMMYNIAKLYNNIQCLSSIKFKLILNQPLGLLLFLLQLGVI